MPELPEVETVMRGLKPELTGRMILNVTIRQPKLRWPVPSELGQCLLHQKILGLSRRGKYLLMETGAGTVILHLGMSGSLRILKHDTPPTRHDHVDIICSENKLLRYNDPRRFGAILWTEDDPVRHLLLESLGVEPLDVAFNGQYLWKKAEKRKVPVKSFIMNGRIVTGIGNIYAAEALFLAGIHPLVPAGQLTEKQYDRLAEAIRSILTSAIAQGGTTLKDFVNSEGKPGYFSQKLHVYGRAKQPCTVCEAPLQLIQLGQRSTVFCTFCQPLK